MIRKLVDLCEKLQNKLRDKLRFLFTFDYFLGKFFGGEGEIIFTKTKMEEETQRNSGRIEKLNQLKKSRCYIQSTNFNRGRRAPTNLEHECMEKEIKFSLFI